MPSQAVDPLFAVAFGASNTALLPPELWRHLEARRFVTAQLQLTNPAAAELGVHSPWQLDMWGFGVLVYTVHTGMPLFEQKGSGGLNQMGCARLRGWRGLSGGDCDRIRASCTFDAEPVLDILRWLLNGSPDARCAQACACRAA